jgi:hypothetical protein
MAGHAIAISASLAWPSATSAANLKFLSVSRQVRDRNFKFRAATQINKLLELL